MFRNKKIEQLEKRINDLEETVKELERNQTIRYGYLTWIHWKEASVKDVVLQIVKHLDLEFEHIPETPEKTVLVKKPKEDGKKNKKGNARKG